ncbi:prepilin-type N-terminal cleavage/methylation domain-containing protein [Anaerocolumna sedimenticola]|uniref:Prepilin-type N-terminal cleavage/methylation domain-containing protein n=1 Tax=Anaerocolumna sedimenticola TaxID=2696063 RepID=A0A6P1TLP4_9FIRM|nr:type II secretion system protein [Anaerocolumna sedimenticola]QHQ61954.1 prepilin-type N-terminal cleavage/methylation domain-containing protein [Anaerocolumna sedimenticola]
MKKRIKIKNDKGFSLVELLVVMAIMAILVGAIAPQVNKYVEKSREARDLQLVSTVFTAVQTGIASSETQVKTITNKDIDYVLKTAAYENIQDEIIDLLGNDLVATKDEPAFPTDIDAVDAIKSKCLSKKGINGRLYVDYTADGKLSVYIAKNSTDTENRIGPVTN